MPRPGGNPLLKQYQIKSSREEPLRCKFTLRITEKMMAQLRSQGEDWREFVREAIAEKLEQQKARSAGERSY